MLVLPLLALVCSSWLLLTDPSDTTYDCPGSTWTLLGRPPVEPPLDGFFDAERACDVAAASRMRTAVLVQSAGLLAGAVVTLRVRRRAAAL